MNGQNFRRNSRNSGTQPDPINESTDICRRVEALIPAFSLGATDPEENAFVEARLAWCPQAVTELAEYTDLANALLFSFPWVEMPPHLADRLLAALAGFSTPP